MWSDRRRPLLEWARVALALDKPGFAIVLLAADDEHSRTQVGPTWPPYLAEVEQTLSAAREQLDEHQIESAWTQGQGMTADEALDHAIAELVPAARRDESL